MERWVLLLPEAFLKVSDLVSHRSHEPFDSWLDAELGRLLAATSRAKAPSKARYQQERGLGARRARRLASGLSAAAGTKVALGAAVTALAAGTGGAIAETMLTGTPNPVVWSEQVVGAVASCGSDLGDRSVPACASEFVKPPSQQRATRDAPGGVFGPASVPGTTGPGTQGGRLVATSQNPSPSAPSRPAASPTAKPSTTVSPSRPPSASPSRPPSPSPPTSSPSPPTSPSPSATATPTPQVSPNGTPAVPGQTSSHGPTPSTR
jgi:hypothetical protein